MPREQYNSPGVAISFDESKSIGDFVMARDVRCRDRTIIVRYWFDAAGRELARKLDGFGLRIHNKPRLWSRENLMLIGAEFPLSTELEMEKVLRLQSKNECS